MWATVRAHEELVALLVLHRSPHIESRLPFVLGRHAAIKVVEPVSGDLLERGAWPTWRRVIST